MVTTLFLTFCDIDMGKIVTEQMSRETLNMTELRAQVRSLELCPWYKGPKNSVKLVSSGHRGNQDFRKTDLEMQIFRRGEQQ